MTAPASRLDIGRVIGRAFQLIRRRWATLGAFFAGYQAIAWGFALFVRPHEQDGRHDPQLALSIALYLGFECLVWLRDTAMIATALQTSPANRLASIADAARAAVRLFPTLAPFFAFAELPSLAETLWRRWTGASQLQAAQLSELLLATGFAELAFALVTIGCWGVVAPVAIVEGGGLWNALARAWRLLSGSRWRLVAIYIVVSVGGAAPAMLAAALTLPFEGALHAAGYSASFLRIEFGAAAFLASIVMATWRVMIAVAYLELRRVREGIVVGDVAEVFA